MNGTGHKDESRRPKESMIRNRHAFKVKEASPEHKGKMDEAHLNLSRDIKEMRLVSTL